MGSLWKWEYRQVRKAHQLDEQADGNTAGIVLFWSLDPLLPMTDWLKRLCCLVLGWQLCPLTFLHVSYIHQDSKSSVRSSLSQVRVGDYMNIWEQLAAVPGSMNRKMCEQEGCLAAAFQILGGSASWCFCCFTGRYMTRYPGERARTKLPRPPLFFPPLGPWSWVSYFSGQDPDCLTEDRSVRLGREEKKALIRSWLYKYKFDFTCNKKLVTFFCLLPQILTHFELRGDFLTVNYRFLFKLYHGVLNQTTK